MSLGDFYRENGESEFVMRLEGVVDEEWRPTAEIAELAGVSFGYAAQALPYLVEEGRAERQKIRRSRGGRRRSRNEWRLPAC